MASIGTLFPATTATTATSSPSSTPLKAATNSLGNQNTFLQLLVAQLKNQDPTQPMEGTTFVTQLAQFSDLQANMGSEQDLNAIAKVYTGTVPSATAATSGTTGTSLASGG